MYRLKFIYFFFILDLNLISMKLKLAKTMEDQEMNFKKKRQSSITYKELRNILKNVNVKESCQNHFMEEKKISFRTSANFFHGKSFLQVDT